MVREPEDDEVDVTAVDDAEDCDAPRMAAVKARPRTNINERTTTRKRT